MVDGPILLTILSSTSVRVMVFTFYYSVRKNWIRIWPTPNPAFEQNHNHRTHNHRTHNHRTLGQIRHSKPVVLRQDTRKKPDYLEEGSPDLNFFFQYDFAATSTSKTTPSINIPQPFHNPLISVPHRLPLFLMRPIFFQAPIKCVACVGNDDELRIDPASNESVV